MMTTLILIAAVFLPSLLGIVGLALCKKWQDRAGRTSPIAGKRIFGAGEQLRTQIEDESTEMFGALQVLFFIGPYFVAIWALQQVDWTSAHFGFGSWILVAGFLLMFATCWRRSPGRRAPRGPGTASLMINRRA